MMMKVNDDTSRMMKVCGATESTLINSIMSFNYSPVILRFDLKLIATKGILSVT